MCVTRGALADARVEVPTFRAVARSTGGDAASMKFVVNGDTEKSRALASGQKRRQLGLKLRAQDGCNLVYVMWRLDPKPKLEVSVKVNPGQRTAKECGADGYTKVKAARVGSLPTLTDGGDHELRAEIRGDSLTAWIDGQVAWEGKLPSSASTLAGPVGVRSDNLAFELKAFDGDGTSAERKVETKCVSDTSD